MKQIRSRRLKLPAQRTLRSTLVLLALAVAITGQSAERNQDKPAQPAGQVSVVTKPAASARPDEPPALPTAMQPFSPTEIYKIGIADVLYIALKNVASGPGYYTVLPDGTIDFPLAGENVLVAGKTCDGIRQMLVSRITLFREPQVEVKVRQYASHKVNVTGLVDRPGDKILQREAVPLFVLRADSGVNANAKKAVITRATLSRVESYDLHVTASDNVLVYSGDKIEFADDPGALRNSAETYFIAGAVNAGGQRVYSNGLTLYQAVIASGGTKGNPRKAILRRRNDKGMLKAVEYNLRSIKGGKAFDPALLPGDMIEIGN